MTIGGDLDSITDSAHTVIHKFACPSGIPVPLPSTKRRVSYPRRFLPISTRRPTLLLLLDADVLGLGSDEAPNLVALQTADPKIANVTIMIPSTRGSQFS